MGKAPVGDSTLDKSRILKLKIPKKWEPEKCPSASTIVICYLTITTFISLENVKHLLLIFLNTWIFFSTSIKRLINLPSAHLILVTSDPPDQHKKIDMHDFWNIKVLMNIIFSIKNIYYSVKSIRYLSHAPY